MRVFSRCEFSLFSHESLVKLQYLIEFTYVTSSMYFEEFLMSALLCDSYRWRFSWSRRSAWVKLAHKIVMTKYRAKSILKLSPCEKYTTTTNDNNDTHLAFIIVYNGKYSKKNQFMNKKKIWCYSLLHHVYCVTSYVCQRNHQ